MAVIQKKRSIFSLAEYFALSLESVDVELTLAVIYDGVELES